MANTEIDRTSREWNYLMSIAKELFPFKSPYKGQLENITDICYSFCVLNKKHVVFEGPTGTGKSVVAYTVAQILKDKRIQYSQRSRVATVSISLQEQYQHDFKDISTLKGKANYSCPFNCGPFGSFKCKEHCKDNDSCVPDKLYRTSIDDDFIKKYNIKDSDSSVIEQLNDYFLKNIKSIKGSSKCPYLNARETYLGLSSFGSTNLHFFCLSGNLQTLGLQKDRVKAETLYYRRPDMNDLNILSLRDPYHCVINNECTEDDFTEADTQINPSQPVVPTYADFVILDECHKLEETLLNIAVLKFVPDFMNDIQNDIHNSIKTVVKTHTWINNPDKECSKARDYLSYINDINDEVESKINKNLDLMMSKLRDLKKYKLDTDSRKSKSEIYILSDKFKKFMTSFSLIAQSSFINITEGISITSPGGKTVSISKLDFLQTAASVFNRVAKDLPKAQKKELGNLSTKLLLLYDSLMNLFSYIDILKLAKTNCLLHVNDTDPYDGYVITEIRFSDAAAISYPLLFSKGYRFLHMSGTVCGPSYHLERLGLNQNDSIILESEPIIPVQNRSISCVPVCSLSSNKICDNTKLVARYIDDIIKTNDIIANNERVFIYTPSFELANTLMTLSKYKSYIEVPPNAKTGVKILEKSLRANKPKIIITPSIIEGIDLKDDLCRYQIIPKIPFLYLGDELVKIKQDLDKDYYGRTTLCKLVQVTGRSIRGKNDYAKTYILDSRFKWFFMNNKQFAPKWWSNAIRWEQSPFKR